MPYTIFTVMWALGIERKTTRLISNIEKIKVSKGQRQI